MSAELIFGICGTALGIGAAVVSITTRLNHIEHLKDFIKENKEGIDELWKAINIMKKDNTELLAKVSKIEGMLEKK